MKSQYATSILFGGGVRVWDVYRQQWHTYQRASDVPNSLLATLPTDERDEIEFIVDALAVKK